MALPLSLMGAHGIDSYVMSSAWVTKTSEVGKTNFGARIPLLVSIGEPSSTGSIRVSGIGFDRGWVDRKVSTLRLVLILADSILFFTNLARVDGQVSHLTFSSSKMIFLNEGCSYSLGVAGCYWSLIGT